MDPNTTDFGINLKYAEALGQIATNLTNAQNTYGFSSPQYQTILEILKQCLRDLENEKKHRSITVDADTLSAAMEHLDIKT
ncbi:hypothetical protein BBP40_009277 [Aspergillus hancockii]|nr:hypothetical protein BBP40_009277 [Aspergillus hancockii]